MPPLHPTARAVRTNDGVEEYWEVVAGDYADEPDLVLAILHAVDSDGHDQGEAVADRVAAALATDDSVRAPYTGLLETEPGKRLAAAAVLHQPATDGFCTSCPTTLWPCSTADALSGGIYLAAGAA